MPSDHGNVLVDNWDAPMLEDVVALIEAWDEDLENFDSLYQLLHADDPTHHNKKAHSIRHDKKRKPEIQNLRSEFQDLLVQFSRSREQKRLRSSVRSIPESRWYMISTHQQQLLANAQAENALLRSLIELQWRESRKLIGEMRLSESIPRPMTQWFTSAEYWGPRLDPRLQLQRLDRLQSEVGRIFQSRCFRQNAHGSSFREVQVRNRQPRDDSIEIVFSAVWCLPCPVNDVADALWIQLTRVAPKGKQIAWTDVYSDSTDSVSQFISQPCISESSGTKHGQVASRRVLQGAEDCSMKLVSTVQLVAFESSFKGTVSSDTLVQVQSLACAPTSLARIQWQCCVHIDPSASYFETPAQRSQWMSLLMAGSMKEREQRNLDWNIQAIENLAMEASVAKRKTFNAAGTFV